MKRPRILSRIIKGSSNIRRIGQKPAIIKNETIKHLNTI